MWATVQLSLAYILVRVSVCECWLLLLYSHFPQIWPVFNSRHGVFTCTLIIKLCVAFVWFSFLWATNCTRNGNSHNDDGNIDDIYYIGADINDTRNLYSLNNEKMVISPSLLFVVWLIFMNAAYGCTEKQHHIIIMTQLSCPYSHRLPIRTLECQKYSMGEMLVHNGRVDSTS